MSTGRSEGEERRQGAAGGLSLESAPEFIASGLEFLEGPGIVPPGQGREEEDSRRRFKRVLVQERRSGRHGIDAKVPHRKRLVPSLPLEGLKEGRHLHREEPGIERE